MAPFYTSHIHMRTLLANTRRSIGVACLLTLAFAGFGAQPASAHNALSTSNPASGAVLTQSPATWSLTFTKEVPLDSATAEFIA
jgi:methionine-rich copper-binding protein CopC